jgi:hypothetical protein
MVRVVIPSFSKNRSKLKRVYEIIYTFWINRKILGFSVFENFGLRTAGLGAGLPAKT